MRKRVIWLVGIVAFVLICMVVSTVDTVKTGIVSDVAGIVAKPFQRLFVGVNNTIDYGLDYFQDMKELKEENAALKSQVILLEDKVAKNDLVNSENERLRGLIDLKERRDDYKVTGASVSATDPTGMFSYFIIDKGSQNDIKKDCVVLDAKGILGRIDKVGTNWARVVTITEPGTACGAEISRTGDTGIIEGDSLLSGECKMTAIPKDADVTPGDYIITSGSGDVYPPGLTIGRIKSLSSDEVSQTAVVQPAANVKSPKEVLVIQDVFPKTYEE